MDYLVFQIYQTNDVQTHCRFANMSTIPIVAKSVKRKAHYLLIWYFIHLLPTTQIMSKPYHSCKLYECQYSKIFRLHIKNAVKAGSVDRDVVFVMEARSLTLPDAMDLQWTYCRPTVRWTYGGPTVDLLLFM